MSIFDDHSYYCNCACAYDDSDGVKTIEISITDPTGHYASYKEGTDLSEVVMDILEDLESQFICNDQRQADLQEIEDIEAEIAELTERSNALNDRLAELKNRTAFKDPIKKGDKKDFDLYNYFTGKDA